MSSRSDCSSSAAHSALMSSSPPPPGPVSVCAVFSVCVPAVCWAVSGFVAWLACSAATCCRRSSRSASAVSRNAMASARSAAAPRSPPRPRPEKARRSASWLSKSAIEDCALSSRASVSRASALRRPTSACDSFKACSILEAWAEAFLSSVSARWRRERSSSSSWRDDAHWLRCSSSSCSAVAVSRLWRAQIVSP